MSETPVVAYRQIAIYGHACATDTDQSAPLGPNTFTCTFDGQALTANSLDEIEAKIDIEYRRQSQKKWG